MKMEKNRELELLDRLFTESWSKPSNVKGFEKWAKELMSRIDKYIEDYNENRDYFSNTEWFSDNQHYLTILFMYDKGFLSKEQLKGLLEGLEFSNNCSGKWQEEISKQFGITFN